MKSYHETPASILLMDRIEQTVHDLWEKKQEIEDKTKIDEYAKSLFWAAIAYRVGWLRLLPWQLVCNQFVIWLIMAVAALKACWAYLKFHTRYRRTQGAQLCPRPIKPVSVVAMLVLVILGATIHWTAVLVAVTLVAPPVVGSIVKWFKGTRWEQTERVQAREARAS